MKTLFCSLRSPCRCRLRPWFMGGVLLLLQTAFGLTMLLWMSQAKAGSLVSYWAGDGNASDSVGLNSGTLFGGTTFAPGIRGQAFSFDDTSYVEAPTIGLPTGNQDRTLVLWFNVRAFRTHESFFAGYGDFGTYRTTYQLGANRLGTTSGAVFFSQWGTAILGPTVQAGTWYNLAVTNVGNIVTLYLNSVSVGTSTMIINTAAGSSFFIGRIPGTLGIFRQLDGLVDEVRVYDYALSASEIQSLNSSPVPEPGSLVLGGVAAALLLLGSWWRRRRIVVEGDGPFA